MKRRAAIVLLVLAGLLPFLLLIWLITRPEKVSLRWTFKKGQLLRYEAASTLIADSRLGPGTSSRDTYSLRVTDVDSAGTATLTWKHESALETSEKGSISPFTVKISALGHITELNGKAPTHDQPPLADWFNLIVPQYGRFESDWSLLWYVALPLAKVGEGDRWSLDFLELPPVPVETKTTEVYELEKVAAGEAHIALVDKRFTFTPESERGRKYLEDTKNAAKKWNCKTVFSISRGILIAQEFEHTSGNMILRKGLRLIEEKSGDP